MGCRILARNLRIGGCELDIVARDGDTILFVEVRSRASDTPVAPEDTVGPAKQRQVKRAADAWIRRYGRREYYYRFDIIAVTFDAQGRPIARHLPGAFR
jgi:putative endonuclease